VPTLDNTAHNLQWPKQGISMSFDQLHSFVLMGCNTLSLPAATDAGSNRRPAVPIRAIEYFYMGTLAI